ncbi:hypothetical protein [Coleofasciculus sp. F4-SAH-05]
MTTSTVSFYCVHLLTHLSFRHLDPILVVLATIRYINLHNAIKTTNL